MAGARLHAKIRSAHALGDKVEPGVPAMLPPLPAGAPTNRLGLAKWLVDEKRRSRALEPFEAYSNFVTGFTHQNGAAYASPGHSPWEREALVACSPEGAIQLHREGKWRRVERPRTKVNGELGDFAFRSRDREREAE
jgi:hypothetical protein